MKVYIEHKKYEFSEYEYYDEETFLNNKIQFARTSLNCPITKSRDFEIGSYIYFIEVGWTKVICVSGCEKCAFSSEGMPCKRRNVMCSLLTRKDGQSVQFEKVKVDACIEKEESKQDIVKFNEEEFLKELSRLLNKYKLKDCAFSGENENGKMIGLYCMEKYGTGFNEKDLFAAAFNASRLYQASREKILNLYDKRK
jgi:hypothetical protein